MSDEAGPSNAAPVVEEELKNEEQCKKLLNQGQILLMRYRYPEAVDVLEDCVKNMARIYGEGHDAIGDAYLYYGRALLGMEQMDESLFQKSLNGDGGAEESSDEEEAGEENGDDNEDEEEGEGEKEDGEKEGAEEKEEKGDGDGEAKGEEGGDVEDTASPDPDADAEGGEDEDAVAAADAVPEEEPPSVAEEIGNMQVAWEVTELARKIFTERGTDDKENVYKLGRTYATLAEIAMISGQFSNSAADFGKACELLKSDSTLRELAENLYLRSNALVSCNRFDEAKEALQSAIDTLSQHQELLRKKETEDAKSEIEEVENLKNQLKGKFDDIEIARDDIDKFRQQKEKIGMANGSNHSSPEKMVAAPSTSGSGSKAVSDISHLLRRRKKPDDEPAADEGTSPKKARTEAEVTPVEEKKTEDPTEKAETNGDHKVEAEKVEGEKPQEMEASA